MYCWSQRLIIPKQRWSISTCLIRSLIHHSSLITHHSLTGAFSAGEQAFGIALHSCKPYWRVTYTRRMYIHSPTTLQLSAKSEARFAENQSDICHKYTRRLRDLSELRKIMRGRFLGTPLSLTPYFSLQKPFLRDRPQFLNNSLTSASHHPHMPEIKISPSVHYVFFFFHYFFF